MERGLRPGRWIGRGTASALLAAALLLAAQAAVAATTLKQAVELAFASRAVSVVVERLPSTPEATPGGMGEAAEFLALDAVDAYLAVLRGRSLLDLAEEHLAAHDATLRSLEADADADPGAVRHAEQRLAQARASLEDRQHDLRDAEADYARRIGQRPGALQAAAPPLAALPVDLAMALEMARRNDLVAAAFFAGPKTLGSADDGAVVPVAGTATTGDRPAIAVSELGPSKPSVFDWALWADERAEAGREGALPTEGQAGFGDRRPVLDSERAMHSAWNALEASRQSVIDLSSAVAFARETREVYGRQLAAAQRSLLDVLDAENELYVATSELTSAETSQALAGFHVLALAGSLRSILGVAIPGDEWHADWKAGLLD